jgi:hypothetical protein
LVGGILERARDTDDPADHPCTLDPVAAFSLHPDPLQGGGCANGSCAGISS